MAVNCTPNWPFIQHNLTCHNLKIAGGVITAFSAKKRRFSFAACCFDDIINGLFEHFKSTADNARGGQGNLSFHFSNAKRKVKMIVSHMGSCMRLPLRDRREDGNDSKEAVLTTQERTVIHFGILIEQQDQILRTLKRNVFAYLKWKSRIVDGKRVIVLPALAFSVNEWIFKTDLSNYMHKKWGLKRSKDPANFSFSNLMNFRYSQFGRLPNPVIMNSFAFAFLRAGESQAAGFIFKGIEPNGDFLQILIGWGYRPVTAPQENDLVVYFDKGIPTHMGRMLASGRVESKLGVNNPYSHEHDVFDIHPQYGRRVVFMRKMSLL